MASNIAGTMFHKSGSDWTRCIATKRRGQGVTDCPVFSKGAHVSSHALAGIGGGTTRRSERSTLIEKPDEANVYTVKGPSRTHYYDGETGRLITWRDRQKKRLKFKQSRRAKVAGPSSDVLDVSQADEGIKKVFKNVESAYGVKIDKYNHDEFVEATEYAYAQASAYFYTNPDPVKAREQRAGFHRAVVYNLLVEKQSPKEAVDGVLERANLGPNADINKVHPSKRDEHKKRVEKQRLKDVQAQINNRARKQEQEKEEIRNDFQIIDEVPEEVEAMMEKMKSEASEEKVVRNENVPEYGTLTSTDIANIEARANDLSNLYYLDPRNTTVDRFSRSDWYSNLTTELQNQIWLAGYERGAKYLVTHLTKSENRFQTVETEEVTEFWKSQLPSEIYEAHELLEGGAPASMVFQGVLGFETHEMNR